MILSYHVLHVMPLAGYSTLSVAAGDGDVIKVRRNVMTTREKLLSYPSPPVALA